MLCEIAYKLSKGCRGFYPYWKIWIGDFVQVGKLLQGIFSIPSKTWGRFSLIGKNSMGDFILSGSSSKVHFSESVYGGWVGCKCFSVPPIRKSQIWNLAFNPILVATIKCCVSANHFFHHKVYVSFGYFPFTAG